MKFVWITPTYRVNIESIFSLQQESPIENPDYITWNNTYNEYLDTLQKELPPLEIDGEMIDPKNDQNIDEEKTNRYIQELRQKIEESLGNEPPEFICNFAIITHTGMKIYVSEDKYKLINSEIDKSQNEKGEV